MSRSGGPDLSGVYHVMYDVLTSEQKLLLLDEIMRSRIANARGDNKESEVSR